MKKTISAAVVGVMSLVSTNSWANLLTNGDFEGAAPTSPGDFLISTTLDAWQSLGYTRTAGPDGFFAQAETGGNGGDFRLVQFIDAAANGITAGTQLQLVFDYIYQTDPAANTTLPRGAYLIGITDDRTYRMYAGTGVDGVSFDNLNTEVLAPDVLLASMALTLNSGGWITNQTLLANITANYLAIGVVFQTSCFGPPEGPSASYCNYERGFDNVSLSKVPEPGSLALLGLGLLGLGLTRRRAA